MNEEKEIRWTKFDTLLLILSIIGAIAYYTKK
jgi:hypothetical protein